MKGIETAQYDRFLGLAEQGYATVVVAAAGFRSADDAYAEARKVHCDDGDVIAHVG